MGWLARFSIRNSVLVHLLVIALILCGSFSLIKLPRELMSEISFNWVFLRLDLPGAAAQETEQLLAVPVEGAIDGVQGIKSVSSRSKEGYAFFSIKFDNVDDATFYRHYQDLKDEVSKVALPEETEEPFWLNFSSQDFAPMVQVVVHGGLENRELFSVTEDLHDDIADIAGIGKIEVGGVQERQIWVEVDPDALSGYSLSLGQVSLALQKANVNVPGGILNVGASQYLLRTVNQFSAIQQIEQAVVGSSPSGGLVRVADIADVEDTFEDPRILSRFEGQPASTLSISKKAGENSIELIEAIRKVVEGYRTRLDGRAQVSISGDTSVQIRQMLNDLQSNALVGMVLVVGVLWIFLGLRNALITALGIPLAFLATFVFMRATGATLNGNSLFGLVLVLGIIVDDAIVLVENCARHRGLGKNRVDAIADGLSEVGIPVIAAILTTIAAFLPLMLMPGVMGRFMRIIPIVVSMALIASLIEALLSLPCHINEWGEQDPKNLERRMQRFSRFIQPYERLLRWLVDAEFARGGFLLRCANTCGLLITFLLFFGTVPLAMFAIFGSTGALLGTVLPGAGAVLIVGMLAIRKRLRPLVARLWANLGRVRFSVFAAVYLVMIPIAIAITASVDLDLFGGDEIPQFSVRVRLPEGTSLTETDRVMKEVERIARAEIPESELKSVTTYSGLLMTDKEWFIKSNVGGLVVDLAQPGERQRSISEIVSALRPKVAVVPGPDSMELVPVKGGPPTGGDVELKVQGPDLDRLIELCDVIEQDMLQVPGVHDVRSDWVIGKKELRVRVDGDRSALLGVSEADVGLALRSAFEGVEATRFQDNDEDVPVLVRYAKRYRNDLRWIERTQIPVATGGFVPFQDLAHVEPSRGVDAIRRYKGQRTITLSASVDRSVTTPVSATQAVQRQLEDFETRFPGYRIDYSGEFEEFQESLKALIYLGVFGLLLVYLVLGTQFRSFIQPMIIIGFTFPGALLGASLALLLTGTPLSISTLYGVVALLGIVVNDSLVYVSFMNDCRTRGAEASEAIVEAGRVRLRPIVLTTVTTVSGLLPMALGIGGKSVVWGPLASTIVCGLVFATATTLLVIPPVYRCFADLEESAKEASRALSLR